ncbi:MAG: hypothetical protein H7322_04840 [Ramlibacter sp.]|nr:hypothetical protein [Ramlibacter sp.]
MTKPVPAAALLLALFALWAPAQAQNVYRCGESYSNAPCPGAIVVPADDPRTATQRTEADAATRRDARSAQVLEKERLRQEARAVPSTSGTLAAARPGQPAASADRSVSTAKLKKPELFTAIAPKRPGDAPLKKKKAKKTAAKAKAA